MCHYVEPGTISDLKSDTVFVTFLYFLKAYYSHDRLGTHAIFARHSFSFRAVVCMCEAALYRLFIQDVLYRVTLDFLGQPAGRDRKERKAASECLDEG